MRTMYSILKEGGADRVRRSLDFREALNAYLQNSYYEINGFLRSNGKEYGMEGETKQMVKALDYGFTDPKIYSIIKKLTTVYRWVESYGLRKKLTQSRPGTRISDKAFLSTTYDEERAISFLSDSDTGILIEIKVPAGTKFIRGRAEEKEFLFDRGHKFVQTKKSTTDPVNAFRGELRVYWNMLPK